MAEIPGPRSRAVRPLQIVPRSSASGSRAGGRHRRSDETGPVAGAEPVVVRPWARASHSIELRSATTDLIPAPAAAEDSREDGPVGA